MKKFLAMVLLGPLGAFAQIVHLDVAGIVESSSSTRFVEGRSYVFSFAFDLSAVPTLNIADVATYSGAATDIVFNYDNGAYVGQGSNLSIWVQNSGAGDGFAVGLPFTGSVAFDPVDGHSLYNGAGSPILDLFDPTGTALSSTSLVNLAAGFDQFRSGGDDRLRLRWGLTGDDALFVATVDSISTFQAQAIPEPAYFALLAGAGGILAAWRWRSRERTTAIAS